MHPHTPGMHNVLTTPPPHQSHSHSGSPPLPYTALYASTTPHAQDPAPMHTPRPQPPRALCHVIRDGSVVYCTVRTIQCSGAVRWCGAKEQSRVEYHRTVPHAMPCHDMSETLPSRTHMQDSTGRTTRLTPPYQPSQHSAGSDDGET